MSKVVYNLLDGQTDGGSMFLFVRKAIQKIKPFDRGQVMPGGQMAFCFGRCTGWMKA